MYLKTEISYNSVHRKYFYLISKIIIFDTYIKRLLVQLMIYIKNTFMSNDSLHLVQ